MAQRSIYKTLNQKITQLAQLRETFLSSKHEDYQASIAEYISTLSS